MEPATYVMEEETLLEMLTRSHEGEDPLFVISEFYANSVESV